MYIKKFDDKGYCELTPEEFFKKRGDIREVFSIDDILHLKEFDINFKSLRHAISNYILIRGMTIVILFDLSISKLEDEWYLVFKNNQDGTFFYICDQIDGLKNCIRECQ